MFRGYVEPVLSLCMKLLLNTSSSNGEVVQCVGKLVGSNFELNVFFLESKVLAVRPDNMCWTRVRIARWNRVDPIVSSFCVLSTVGLSATVGES